MTKGYRVFMWDEKHKEWNGQAFALPTRAKAERMAKSHKEKTKIVVSYRIPVVDVRPY